MSGDRSGSWSDPYGENETSRAATCQWKADPRYQQWWLQIRGGLGLHKPASEGAGWCSRCSSRLSGSRADNLSRPGDADAVPVDAAGPATVSSDEAAPTQGSRLHSDQGRGPARPRWRLGKDLGPSQSGVQIVETGRQRQRTSERTHD